MADKPKLLIGMPHNGEEVYIGAARCFFRRPAQRYDALLMDANTSILTQCFNMLLCSALNYAKDGVTHLGLIHDDIDPQMDYDNPNGDGAFDILMDEIISLDADIVSAVSPIKNAAGLTSTALDNPTDTVSPYRLTMSQVYDLPATFSREDCAKCESIDASARGWGLLVNTGLMVIDLRKPWLQDFIRFGGFSFENLIRHSNGQYIPFVKPEDWNMSRVANACGAKVYATRKVPLIHWGELGYDNRHPWGAWKEDQSFLHNQRVDIQ